MTYEGPRRLAVAGDAMTAFKTRRDTGGRIVSLEELRAVFLLGWSMGGGDYCPPDVEAGVEAGGWDKEIGEAIDDHRREQEGQG